MLPTLFHSPLSKYPTVLQQYKVIRYHMNIKHWWIVNDMLWYSVWYLDSFDFRSVWSALQYTPCFVLFYLTSTDIEVIQHIAFFLVYISFPIFPLKRSFLSYIQAACKRIDQRGTQPHTRYYKQPVTFPKVLCMGKWVINTTDVFLSIRLHPSKAIYPGMSYITHDGRNAQNELESIRDPYSIAGNVHW